MLFTLWRTQADEAIRNAHILTRLISGNNTAVVQILEEYVSA
jgi:hypothetical protein